jgi:glycosyltransferase involved in cell wall biosynthesis
MLRALDEEIAAQKPDVLHLFGWGTAQLWERGRGIPAVHVAVDSWSLGVRNRLLPGWRAFLERDQPARIIAHERRHYPRCGAVVVVSPPDAEAIRAAVPGARVEVVPLGVDAGPEPGTPVSDPAVGFHGVFLTEANRDGAVTLARDVFPLIEAREPNARLMLIGRDPGPEILGLARDRVEVTGRVDDVRARLDRLAVYVAPMVSGQGMKHKILEAMAAGLPVVTTPMGLDGIGETPGVRVGKTPQELAEHVLALLRSPEERAEAGRAARRRVIADFTWERSSRAIESLWAELAGRRPIDV